MDQHSRRHRRAGSQYQRFDRYHRLLHGVLMFSFLGLAFTGMPLLFSDAPVGGPPGGGLRRRPCGRHHPPRSSRR